jgi:cysteinylglycine-S-conjugate dipeptidase
VSDTDSIAAAVNRVMMRARDDLGRLVALRSVADPDVEPPEECSRTATEVARLLHEVGIDHVRAIQTDDGSQAVVGHAPGPEGAPTVLLYSHYDVQPAGDLSAWESSPWELTDRDGRWYGRGAADCKGNLVMLLSALRALPRPWPVGIRVVCEGAEEMSTGGLEALVRAEPSLFAADVMLIADSGNVEPGLPTITTSLRGTGSVLVTVRTLTGPVHSGMYGGAAPDALAALIRMLATLRDGDGVTTITGLDANGHWSGAEYPVERFRTDAGVLDGVSVLGASTVADALWARPVANVIGLDAPGSKEQPGPSSIPSGPW